MVDRHQAGRLARALRDELAYAADPLLIQELAELRVMSEHRPWSPARWARLAVLLERPVWRALEVAELADEGLEEGMGVAPEPGFFESVRYIWREWRERRR